MSRVSYKVAGKSIDTGYTDTISLLVDMFKLVSEIREYKELEIPTKRGFIRKNKLIIPFSVSYLISSILSTDFEEYDK